MGKQFPSPTMNAAPCRILMNASKTTSHGHGGCSGILLTCQITIRNELKRIYHHELVLTRDELPDIMGYLNIDNETVAPSAGRQMENLDRGVIAIRKETDSVFIGWRLMGTEPDEIAFNVYRQSGKSKPVRLNKAPITECTRFY